MLLPLAYLRFYQLEFPPKKDPAIGLLTSKMVVTKFLMILILAPNIGEPKRTRTSAMITNGEHDGNMIRDMAHDSLLDVIS